MILLSTSDLNMPGFFPWFLVASLQFAYAFDVDTRSNSLLGPASSSFSSSTSKLGSFLPSKNYLQFRDLLANSASTTKSKRSSSSSFMKSLLNKKKSSSSWPSNSYEPSLSQPLFSNLMPLAEKMGSIKAKNDILSLDDDELWSRNIDKFKPSTRQDNNYISKGFKDVDYYFKHVHRRKTLKDALRRRMKVKEKASIAHKAKLQSNVFKSLNSRLNKMSLLQKLALTKSLPIVKSARSMKSRRNGLYVDERSFHTIRRPKPLGSPRHGTFDGTVHEDFSDGNVPGTFSDGNVPGTFSDGNVPGTFSDGNVPGTFSDGNVPGTFSDGNVPGTFSDGNVPGTFSDGTVPGTFSDGNVPGDFRDGYFTKNNIPHKGNQFAIGSTDVLVPGDMGGFIISPLPENSKPVDDGFFLPSPSSTLLSPTASSLTSLSSSGNHHHRFAPFPTHPLENGFDGFASPDLPSVQPPELVDTDDSSSSIGDGFGFFAPSSSNVEDSLDNSHFISAVDGDISSNNFGGDAKGFPSGSGTVFTNSGSSEFSNGHDAGFGNAGATGFSHDGDFVRGYSGSFAQDTSDCETISTKVCRSSKDCSCNGFYSCFAGRCILQQGVKDQTPSRDEDVFGGSWHDGPVMEIPVSQSGDVSDIGMGPIN